MVLLHGFIERVTFAIGKYRKIIVTLSSADDNSFLLLRFRGTHFFRRRQAGLLHERQNPEKLTGVHGR